MRDTDQLRHRWAADDRAGGNRPTPMRMAALASIVASGIALGGGIGFGGDIGFGNATANAAIDSSNTIVDHGERTIEAIQQDTRIDFVPPLDGNPLTREWFHSGEAAFHITGPRAGDWAGHITIGYEVGYPATLNGNLTFNWSTPGLEFELGGSDGLKADLTNVIPTLGLQLQVGFGPGIKDIECAGGDVSGTEGFIRMSGFHGTVSGVLGRTTIRPWVRVVGSTGDTVITYGPLWSI
ncbi:MULTISPECIES: MspA family porin [unclassified Nocardia]|uniref:MspA family porin n=1 Tax=unclassified Nocardia TaxID=2637762 RepID=UPI001CE4A7CD|nr:MULTISPECIES: MspA family porin [unclassified Nocardia]